MNIEEENSQGNSYISIQRISQSIKHKFKAVRLYLVSPNDIETEDYRGDYGVKDYPREDNYSE